LNGSEERLNGWNGFVILYLNIRYLVLLRVYQ